MNFSGKAVFLTAVIITVTLVVPAVGQPERGIEVGQKIEPRQLTTIERDKIMLPVEEGLTVLLFWSTWSPRSGPALELWKEYGDLYKEHGISVLTVIADHQHMEVEDIDKVREYIARNEIALPVIVDSELKLFNEIGIIVLPTVFFLKPDGTLDYKYAGFPTSAEMDLKEDLEAKLGIAREPAAEEEAARGKLAYQPRNNALLFYNMGKRIHEKGFPEKAKAKYIEALERDTNYTDPLRELERMFFAKGWTPEAEDRLKTLLIANGLEGVIEKIQEKSEGMEAEPVSAAEAAVKAGQVSAPAATPVVNKLTPMERMKLLMQKDK